MDAFSRDQGLLCPGEVLGQRQETFLWISAEGCSFEGLCVSVVWHQLSSSLKPSHPIQHQREGGRSKTAEKKQSTRGSRTAAGLGRCSVNNVGDGRQREIWFSCFSPRSFFFGSLMTFHSTAEILIGCFNSKCPHLPSLLPLSSHFLAF